MSVRMARGQRVGDRYRLEREIGRGADGITWEAVDERLDRPVALRIFDERLDRKTIVTRAGVAASLAHPRVVRVFDTGEDGGRFFTVSELMPESLESVRLPLSADGAIHVATNIAEALQYAHERNVVHGNLRESNVLLSEGSAKVGDFGLSGAAARADKDVDLKQFGALVRRIVKVPDPSAPEGFARVVEGLASGGYVSAGEALHDLRQLRPRPTASKKAPRSRRWLIVVIALLLVVAAFGVIRLGERSPGPGLVPGGKIAGTPLRVVLADDFDPFTTDRIKSESPGEVRNAIDDDASTFWRTENYKSGANLAGKPGVGLILDLGRSIDVGKAQVLFVLQGCRFELRYTDDLSAPVDEWGVARKIEKSPTSAAFEFDSATARYWLVWITRLVPEGAGFRCGVKEAELFSP